MADGGVNLQQQQSFFKMDVVKTVAKAGAAGGGYMVVSDFFLNRYWKGDNGEDVENAELMRAGAQAVIGLGLATAVAKWDRVIAVGIGIGAIVGAARHLFRHWDFEATLNEWFPENDDDTPASGVSYMGG